MTRRRNTYRYGYLDKVLSVTGGKERRTFTYHADGQLATATRTGGSRPVATDALFTGKPHVDGLGYAFLFRNYRPSLGKWQTADPLGYPDGWNQMAYGINSPISGIDIGGAAWGNFEMVSYYYRYGFGPFQTMYGQIISWIKWYYDSFDTDFMDLTSGIYGQIMALGILDRVKKQITNKLIGIIRSKWRSLPSFGSDTYIYETSRSYTFEPVVWALGDGSVSTYSDVMYTWSIYENLGGYYCALGWSSSTDVSYWDVFQDPTDTEGTLGFSLEAGGVPYEYYHTWYETLNDLKVFRLE